MSSALADDPNKNVVIYINDFFPEFAVAFTKLSQKLGRPLHGVLLVDAERKASGKYRSYPEGNFEEIVIDFSDDAALRKAIKPFENNLLLVSCDSERSQLYFQKIIPHVPYVGAPTESSIVFSTDKGKMRELLRSYDESISPKATVLQDATPESVKKVCAAMDFPVIVKPTNLAAAILVNKANNEDELGTILKTSFTSLSEVYSQHRGLGSKTMIVEEFVEGDLYTTDAYVDAIGKVYVLPFIHFQNGSMVGMEGYQIHQEETYHTLTDEEQRQGVLVAEKAVHAVGLRSSVAHIELFRTNSGWKIVELGARPGGWRQEMYGVSYGIDHAFNELLVKIGLEPEMPSSLKTYSGLFIIYTPKPGIIESFSGLEEARKHPQMYALRINASIGDRALPSMQGGELLVDGVMYNADHEQLDRDMAAMRDHIIINIKQDEDEKS
jgi:biotin carboxylase